MKRTLKNGRKFTALILTILLVLGITGNVFASWTTYNTGVVYLDETWIGSKQCINFYQSGQWVRNVASQSHTLWINSIPILNNLYGTCYWCFDENGNTFAINTSKELLLCQRGTTTFQRNTAITRCTGFQRGSNKVGYLVYTEGGKTYRLSDVLNGNYNSVNTGTNSTISGTTSLYPYVETLGNCYYYHVSSNKFFKYFLSDSVLYYLGTNDNDSNVMIARGVKAITFDINKGYIVFAYENNSIEAYPLGVTASSNKQSVGSDFCYFDGQNKISSGYVNNSGGYQKFSYTSNSNYNNYYDNYYEDDYEDNYYYTDYPYVEKSGSNYFYRTSSSIYHKYSLSSNTLYYNGTNSKSKSVKLATNVKRITFDTQKGYIVFADKNDMLWAFKIGYTSSIKYVGKYFSNFDANNYVSEGYYKTIEEYYEEFSYSNYDEDEFPRVEISGNYLYYRTSKTKYHKYHLSGTTLYYKGTQSSSSNTKLATDIEDIKDITFSNEGNGYIVFSNDEDKVYAYPVGKTSSIYEEYLGRDFGYFDDEDYSFSEGYYDSENDFFDFDFDF